MSQNAESSLKKWSSEEDGWVIKFLSRPEGVENMPEGVGPGTAGEAFQKHFESCFEYLKHQLGDGVRIHERWEWIGACGIIGPEDACLRLQEKLTADGQVAMAKNLPCVRPALKDQLR